MKIQEVLFVVISIFAVIIEATNVYSNVDVENDVLKEPDDEITIPLKLDIVVDEIEDQQGMFTKKKQKVTSDDLEIFIDDQKILMKVKLELLKLQNKAITSKFHDLEKNNKKLKEKLDTMRHHEDTSQKPVVVHLDAGSEIFIIRLKKCIAFLILFHYFYKFT